MRIICNRHVCRYYDFILYVCYFDIVVIVKYYYVIIKLEKRSIEQ